MYQQQKPVPGTIYTHFKEGKKYQIVTIAFDSENGEEMVVYQALYGDFKTYVRPLAMFLEVLDRNKYPNAVQKHRFEKVELAEKVSGEEKGNIFTEEEEPVLNGDTVVDNSSDEIHPKFRLFLDAETTEERLSILRDMREILDDTMINSIAVVMDVTVKEGRLDERYDELLYCIQLKQQYELNRFR